jgi:hypothetical protein
MSISGNYNLDNWWDDGFFTRDPAAFVSSGRIVTILQKSFQTRSANAS